MRGRSRQKDFRDARLLQARNIRFGNNPADENRDVVHAFFAEKLHKLRAERVVSAGEDGETDDVHVLLSGGGGDHLGGLAEAGVNDLHAGVAKSASDDLVPALVAVEPRFGNAHPNFLLRHSLRSAALLASQRYHYPHIATQTV